MWGVARGNREYEESKSDNGCYGYLKVTKGMEKEETRGGQRTKKKGQAKQGNNPANKGSKQPSKQPGALA